MIRLLRLLPLLVLAVVLFTPSRAEARRGIVLITHGDTIKHVADLPTEVAENLRAELGGTVAVGYKYTAFGIFWLDIWTWGGEHCLYQGDTFYEATPEQIAELMGGSADDLSKPWGYIFPPGLMGILAVVAIWIPMAIKGKAEEKQLAQRFETLMEDSRYQKAVEIISTRSAAAAESEEGEGTEDAAEETAETVNAADKPDPFDEAVQSLVDQGIDREEATENLSFVVSVLVAHANAEEA